MVGSLVHYDGYSGHHGYHDVLKEKVDMDANSVDNIRRVGAYVWTDSHHVAQRTDMQSTSRSQLARAGTQQGLSGTGTVSNMTPQKLMLKLADPLVSAREQGLIRS